MLSRELPEMWSGNDEETMKNNHHNMTIAIASGKGGTGKTTVAVNLAKTLSEDGYSVTYLDCDVEEPNGHIFLKPVWDTEENVEKLIPEIDESKCIHCEKCNEICQFSAILDIGSEVLTFPDLCHSCGGCTLVCPTKAVTRKPVVIGNIKSGSSDEISFIHGELIVGQPIAPPVIHAVKKKIKEIGIHLIDAPPGTSCPVIESVRSSDFVLLVTEPTPFGLNDLKLAVDLLNLMKIPFAVIINQEGLGDLEVQNYCNSHRIPILMTIPFDRRIAEAYSRGDLMINVIPSLRNDFLRLYKNVKDSISK